MNSKYEEVRNDHTDDNGVTYIDAWKHGQEDGQTIAYVIKGEAYYVDMDATIDFEAQEAIKEAIENQKELKIPNGIVEVTGIVQDKNDYFKILFDVNGTRSESITIHKIEEIKERFNLTDEQIDELKR